MVCLKASQDDLAALAANGTRCASFTDEDLDSMTTAVAFGPLEREEGWRLFGSLSLA